MSANTAEKRFSFISLGSPAGRLSMPVPGSASLSEERHLQGRYAFGLANTVLPKLINKVYFITRRYLNGKWYYVSEHMDDRLWKNVEDTWCVDCGLSTTLYMPDATLTPAAATGGSVEFSVDSGIFASYMVGNVIRVGGGIATITSYTSATTVVCNITQDITNVVPNDPNNMPIPAKSGDWTMGVPVTTITGLNHLEGKEVAIIADGSVVPNQTVTNGSITLPAAATLVKIGLPFTAQLQNMYLDPQGPVTSQGKRKNIYSAVIRMDATRGVKVGSNQDDSSTQQNQAPTTWSNLKEIKERGSQVEAGNAIPLFTGDHYINIPANWDERGQLAVQQDYPLPANILAFIINYVVGDTPG